MPYLFRKRDQQDHVCDLPTDAEKGDVWECPIDREAWQRTDAGWVNLGYGHAAMFREAKKK